MEEGWEVSEAWDPLLEANPRSISSASEPATCTLATNDNSNLGNKQPQDQLHIVHCAGPAAPRSDPDRSKSRGSVWDEAPLAKRRRSSDDAQEKHMSWVWLDEKPIYCLNDDPVFDQLYWNVHWLMEHTWNASDFKFGNLMNQEAVRASWDLGEYSFADIATCGKNAVIGVATNAKSQKKVAKLALAITGALAKDWSCSKTGPREIDVLVQKAQGLFEGAVKACAPKESPQNHTMPTNLTEHAEDASKAAEPTNPTKVAENEL